MKNKKIEEVYVVGSGKLPKQLHRDINPPKEVLSNPIAARIQELLVFNPGVAEFRVNDLKKFDEKTLKLLLSDIENALEIPKNGR